MPKAVQFDSYGGVNVLEVRDVPRPVPQAGEVLVEVRAAGINPSEAVIRSGALADQFPARFPSGQGSDLAGVVAELGSGVRDFAVGDEVIGFSMRRCSHAEYVAVPANQLTAKPSELSWEVAGSLFAAGATAYGAVRAVRLVPGETVAIAGAAGGVGSIAVQLARRAGATVLGIAGHARAVADWVLGQTSGRSGARYEIIDLADHPLPFLDEPMPPSFGQYQHDHTKAWAATIGGYDGFIFVTPEYNHSTSGVLKNAIDYLYAEWNNKAAAFVAYGSLGGARAIEHVRGVCGELQIATIRQQLSFSLFTDFENFAAFTPAALHNGAAVSLFDQLESWAGALRPLRA